MEISVDPDHLTTAEAFRFGSSLFSKQDHIEGLPLNF